MRPTRSTRCAPFSAEPGEARLLSLIRAWSNAAAGLWTAAAAFGGFSPDFCAVELAVTPEDLSAAAAALTSCSRRLEEAREAFARTAAREVPELGREALAAASESARRAEGAVGTIADDVEQLARALRVLAHVYAQVDRGAVHK